MRNFLALSICLFCMQIADATDFSVVGTRLGMTGAEVIRALPPDMRSSSRQELLGLLGELPFPAVRVAAGTPDCGWARWKEYGQPCLSYNAILMNTGNEFRTISISLQQYYETPVAKDAFEQLMLASYGEPDFRIPQPKTEFDAKTGPITSFSSATRWPDGQPLKLSPFSLLPISIWSPDLAAISETSRSSILEPISNLGRFGMKAPMLRVFLNTDQEQVLGVELLLIDPVAWEEWNLRTEEAEMAARHAIEHAAKEQIKLK